jgi:hypothetical protein
MTAPGEHAQHSRRVFGIARLAQNLIFYDNDSVSTKDESRGKLLRDSVGFLP